ncbi:MAG: RusA family crossover junction endodeoxyribonuclease [Thermoplasmata archaeon]
MSDLRPLVDVYIPGEPKPQGSKVRGRGGGLYEASREVAAWRERVALATSAVFHGDPVDEPVAVNLAFAFMRPRGHYGKKGLRRSAPCHKVSRPDLDKLARAVLDAITGVVIRDDAQVVRLQATKIFADDKYPGGAYISVGVLTAGGDV